MTPEMLWNRYKFLLIIAGLIVVALFATVVKVPETQQAVVLRFGEPVRVMNQFNAKQQPGSTGAGLFVRVPFVEQLVRIDKRLLSVDMESEQVLSTDQLRLIVDAYARFRIIDPVRMLRTTGTTDRLQEQLRPILTSVLRQELGKRTFQSLLTAERGHAMHEIREGLDLQAREYGAQVIDVRIKRADLPEGALESAFARMQAAREQEATTIRAQGHKRAEIKRAEATATAAKIYADSFSKDADFYNFYRAMKSYDYSFGEDAKSTTILISPDSSYLKEFKGN